jgi:hypothetical protein
VAFDAAGAGAGDGPALHGVYALGVPEMLRPYLQAGSVTLLPSTITLTLPSTSSAWRERLGDAVRDVHGDRGRRRHRVAAASSSSRLAGNASVKVVDLLSSRS